MNKKQLRYNPKPKNEFEKRLFKRFETYSLAKTLNREVFEKWKKEQKERCEG